MPTIFVLGSTTPIEQIKKIKIPKKKLEKIGMERESDSEGYKPFSMFAFNTSTKML